jgi:hypothetical protein
MDYRSMKLDKDKGKTVVDYENVPEQRGDYKPLLQPGDFLFRLPKNLDLAWAEPFDAKVGDKGTFERIAVQFDAEHPLAVIGAPAALKAANPSVIGETVRCRISNAERNRARKGDPAAYVSDMYYFLFEGMAFDGKKPADNMEWITAVNAQAGKEFVAALTWSSFCSVDKVRYIDDGQGGTTEDPDKQRGCGARYYQSGLPRDEAGLYLERFTCSGKKQIEGGVVDCGASLRCFPNLERFRPASFAAGW